MFKLFKRGIATIISSMMLVSVIPAATAGTAFASTYSIPSTAKQFNGHYYKVYQKENITWDKAEKLCESLGGHLVTITSLKESLFIEKMTDHYADYWLGAYTKSDRWRWVTGESTSFAPYSGWPHVYNSEQHAYYDANTDKLSYSYGSKSYYICEWDTTTKNILPDQVTGLTISKVNTTSVTVSWKKVSGAKGYCVYMKQGKNGSYKKIADNSGVSNTGVYKSGLKKGKTYYFCVRAYKTIFGEKSFGDLSVEKSKKMR